MQAGSGEMAHLLDDSRLREVAARSGAAADAACCAGRGMKTASDLSWALPNAGCVQLLRH